MAMCPDCGGAMLTERPHRHDLNPYLPETSEHHAWAHGWATARAALLAELEAGVEGLLTPPRPGTEKFTQREFMDWARAAVLDLIRKAGKG